MVACTWFVVVIVGRPGRAHERHDSPARLLMGDSVDFWTKLADVDEAAQHRFDRRCIGRGGVEVDFGNYIYN